eukprot:scaffold68185_cov40-Cyclotella_meneghiniana.AAC.3
MSTVQPSAQTLQNQQRVMLQMSPQLDTIKAAHFDKIIALRIEAHRSGQSSVANEDLTKARNETIASINALNCAFFVSLKTTIS